MNTIMSVLPHLPRGLQTVTFVVAVLAFGALVIGLGVTAATQGPTPDVAAWAKSHRS